MNLIGDIGNTEVKICLINTNFKIIKKIVLKTSLISNSYLNKKLSFLNNYKKHINKALFCSVVPSAFKKIKKFIKKNININCNELKEFKLSNFLSIKVNKKQVGSDRLANALGTIDNKSNYIIVDFGTATTFDVVIKKNYLGGVIAPGVNLSLNTLSSKAFLIPNINLLKVSNVVGKNTKNAVRSGFYWGYSGLIENIIRLIIKQTHKSFKIIFTGGQAHLFKKAIKRKIRIDRDLTINGLLKVLKGIE